MVSVTGSIIACGAIGEGFDSLTLHMKKEQKEFIDKTVEALESLKKQMDALSETTENNEIIKNALPFLVIGFDNIKHIIQRYIDDFKKIK